MKKTILLLAGMLFFMTSFAQSPFTVGDGSAASPYQITTTAQLNAVRDNLTSNFMLMNDLDLSIDYPTWVPIGRELGQSGNTFAVFSGSFDGQGHVISGINIEWSEMYAGFFAVASGSISNLGVKGSLNNPGVNGASCGLLVGYLGQTNLPGTILNCFAEGSIEAGTTLANGHIGLLVGNLTNASIVSGCYAKGTVNAPSASYVGGLVGRMNQNTCAINNSYADVNVVGKNYVGGLCGQFYSNKNQNIGFLYATGSVTGENWVGGVAGNFYNSVVGLVNAGAIIAANTSVKATVGPNVNRVGPFQKSGGQAIVAENIYGLSTTEVMNAGVPVTIISDVAGADGSTKTLAELQNVSFYGVWNFEHLWKMPVTAGLPVLQLRTAVTDFSGGNGTQVSPLEITTTAELNRVRYYMTKYFILKNNLDLSTDYPTWLPLGKDANGASNSFTRFSGSFDGQGHVISGINIVLDATYVGFFAVVTGTISNLGVKGSLNNPTGTNCGLLVGYVGNGTPVTAGTILNCFAVGSVQAQTSSTTGQIGLLVGNLTYGSTVKGCCAKGTVNAPNATFVGGLVGRVQQNSCAVLNSYSEVDVVGNNWVGGISGRLYSNNNQNIGFLYATGSVTGNNWVGGIAGDIYNTTLGLVNAGPIIAANTSVKALVGPNVNRVGPIGESSGVPTPVIMENIYGLYTTEVLKAGVPVTITSDIAGADGLTKTLVDLHEASFYSTWDMVNTWEMPIGGGFPTLKALNGGLTVGVKENTLSHQPTIFSNGNLIVFKNITESYQASVYDLNGVMLKNFIQNEDGAVVVTSPSPIVIIKLVGKSGATISTKVVRK